MTVFTSEIFWIGFLLVFFGVGFIISMIVSRKEIVEELSDYIPDSQSSGTKKFFSLSALLYLVTEGIKSTIIILIAILVGIIIMLSEIFNFDLYNMLE